MKVTFYCDIVKGYWDLGVHDIPLPILVATTSPLPEQDPDFDRHVFEVNFPDEPSTAMLVTKLLSNHEHPDGAREAVAYELNKADRAMLELRKVLLGGSG